MEKQECKLKLGSSVAIGDPCYMNDDDSNEYYYIIGDVLPGNYKYYVEYFNTRPSILTVWHSDYKRPKKWTHLDFFSVDSGQLGVFDASIIKNDDFYYIACDSTYPDRKGELNKLLKVNIDIEFKFRLRHKDSKFSDILGPNYFYEQKLNEYNSLESLDKFLELHNRNFKGGKIPNHLINTFIHKYHILVKDKSELEYELKIYKDFIKNRVVPKDIKKPGWYGTIFDKGIVSSTNTGDGINEVKIAVKNDLVIGFKINLKTHYSYYGNE